MLARCHPQVSKPDLSALEARLRTINSLASIQRTQRSVVPVDYVLGVGGFDLGRIEEQVGLHCFAYDQASVNI